MAYLYFHIVMLSSILAFCISSLISYSSRRRTDAAIGEDHECRAPPRLPNQRPYGLDRIEEIFRANTESRLMQLFLFHFRLWGNTFEQNFLGARALGTIEPQNLEVMLTNSEDWSIGIRRKVMFPLFGEGIFTQEGPSWKHSRDLLRPQLVHSQYEDLGIFREAVDNLRDAIPKDGIVDLQPLFSRLTLDTTTAFLFGETVNSLQEPESPGRSTFAGAFNLAQDYVAKRLRLQDFYWLVGGTQFRQACKDVQDFADRIIDQNLLNDKNERSRYVFLDSVAKSTMNRTVLRSQIINILVAGRDTTACTLSWTFFLLIRHPEAFKTLKAEIIASYPNDQLLNRSALQRMTYLQKVLKETLRLYPPVPVNSRTALRTTILPVSGGDDLRSPVLVSKGTIVGYSVYSMHRRPDLYGMDAELFRPERWDEWMPLKDDPVASKWGYLPFNGGPRTCLGKDFAMTELAYTIVRLIQAFPMMRLPPNEKVELLGVEKQTMTLVMSITRGCKVALS